MTKAKKTERRTIIGRVARVEDAREYEGDVVINIDIETPGQNPRVFTDVALWGQEAHALLQGKRLSEDLTEWVQFQAPVKVGARVQVQGSWSLRSWKATKGKSKGKTIKTGYIPVYSHEQLRVVTLPKL